MSKKSKYEPHPKLATKLSDSRTADYDRVRNREIIEEQLEVSHDHRVGIATGIDADFQFDEVAQNELEQEMYENGFHYEQPEDFQS